MTTNLTAVAGFSGVLYVGSRQVDMWQAVKVTPAIKCLAMNASAFTKNEKYCMLFYTGDTLAAGHRINCG